MSELRKLASHATHFLTGRTLVMALGFVSFPIFARLFSVADYGILNLVQRVVLFATALSKLGLQQALLRFGGEAGADETKLRQVYSTCAALALAGIAALLALYSLGLTAWIHAGSLPSSLPAPLWAAGALVATRTLTAVLLGMFRLEERTRLYSVIDVAQRLFTFLFALAVLVWIARRPSLFLLAAAAAEGLVLAAAWLLSARRERVAFTAFDRPLAGRILAYSSPLVGYEILMILLGSVDRPLIQAYLGSESLGYWAAAISLATYAEEALQAPLGLAIYPICQRLWQESGLDAVSAFLSRVLIYLGGAMGLLLAGSIVTSREIIILLGSRKYEAAAPLLAPLMFALLVYAMAGILNTGPLLMKKTLSMAGVVFGALCAKVALALLLLPSFGLWGMAGATFAGYAVLLAFMIRASRSCIPIRWSPAAGAGITATTAIAAFAGSLLPAHGSPLAALLLRGGATTLVYAAAACLLVAEFRPWPLRLWRRLRAA